MERKKRTFENFLSDKIVNLSDSAKNNIIYSNKIFEEFCKSKYNLNVDEVIIDANRFGIEEKTQATNTPFWLAIPGNP